MAVYRFFSYGLICVFSRRCFAVEYVFCTCWTCALTLPSLPFGSLKLYANFMHLFSSFMGKETLIWFPNTLLWARICFFLQYINYHMLYLTLANLILIKIRDQGVSYFLRFQIVASLPLTFMLVMYELSPNFLLIY